MEDKKKGLIIIKIFQTPISATLKRRQGYFEETVQENMSQADRVYNILKWIEIPLHISTIIDHIERFHGVRLKKESVVSALSKEIRKGGHRFERVGKGRYALRSFHSPEDTE